MTNAEIDIVKIYSAFYTATQCVNEIVRFWMLENTFIRGQEVEENNMLIEKICFIHYNVLYIYFTEVLKSKLK